MEIQDLENFIFYFLSRETEGLALRCLSNQPILGMVLTPIDVLRLEDKKTNFNIIEDSLLIRESSFYFTLFEKDDYL